MGKTSLKSDKKKELSPSHKDDGSRKLSNDIFITFWICLEKNGSPSQLYFTLKTSYNKPLIL